MCTDADYDKFWPVDSRSEYRLYKAKSEPNQGMLCIDWETAGIDFYGLEASGTYAELEVIVMPCNMRGTYLGGQSDNISKECIPDLEQQIKYLGPMNMQVYYNTQRFDQNEYGEAEINKTSTFKTVQVD